MTTEQKLIDLIKAKYGNLVKFTSTIEMPNSTLATILKRGIDSASISNIIKICHALEISVDELAKGNIVPIEHTEKDRLMDELPVLMAYINKHREDYADITIDGEPLSNIDWTILINGMQVIIESIRTGRQEQ